MISIHTLSTLDFHQELFTLSRQFFEEYQHYHPSFFTIDQLTADHICSYFSHFLNNQDAAAYIALDNSQANSPIIGYLTVSIKDQPDYWTIKKVGEISGLMVAKQYRRKGIARLLLRQAKVTLADRGIRYITAYTAVANESAIFFYSANKLEPLYTTVLGSTSENN